MTRPARRAFSSRVLLAGAALLAAASMAAPPARAEGLSYRGWGPRVGLSVSPDQVFAGAHWDLGEIVEHLRLQPNAELGIGDGEILLTGGVPALWFFDVGTWKPYVGGELSVVLEDRREDEPGRSSGTDIDLGLSAVGGLETELASHHRFFLELKVGLTGTPDAKLLAGWTF